ncbi:MAG TPA: rod shape-determining protein MreD [Rhizomicrobium sp.]
MATLERAGHQPRLKFLSALVPLACGLLGVFIANIPISLSGGAVPPPLLALVPVYFWCLVRPDLMSPAAALVIGFAEDLLSGGPPGVWTLAFVLTYALVARQRDSFAGLSGVVAVMGFAAASAFACAVAYFTIAFLVLLAPGPQRLPLFAPIISELAMTVLFYVPTALVIGWIHHRLVGALRGDI